MDSITPEIVARLATKIYQETMGGSSVPGSPAATTAGDYFPGNLSSPHGTAPAITGSMPGVTHHASPSHAMHAVSPTGRTSEYPSEQDVPRNYVSAGQTLHPTAFVTSDVPFRTDMVPAFEPKRAMPAASQVTAKAEESAGLKEFVRQVRTATYRDPTLTEGGLLPDPRRRATFTGVPSEPYTRSLDPLAVRADFPILNQKVNGHPLAWLDNAATTQKPRSVIEAVARFYERDNSNIHRGAHTLAARATDAYEHARDTVARFLGASSSREIVFVRGTTEGINFVARTFGADHLRAGDEILLTVLEHHANIVPWQMIARERGAVLRVVPVDDAGDVVLSEYQRLLGPRTKLVALAHANNSLGTIVPIAEMTAMAKRFQARVLVDGAQSVAHLPVRVKELGVDFYVFSGHKVFGPTGIGAVYVTEELHDLLPPWQGGGNMIRDVTFESTTYADAPAKFEAGTPNIADAVGLAAALDYVQRLGLATISRYEHELLGYATQRLLRVPGLRMIGHAREKVGVLSFVMANLSPQQVGERLNEVGIAVRAGHHCAQPSLRRFGLEATVRPSLSIYNTREEVDHLADTLHRLSRMR